MLITTPLERGICIRDASRVSLSRMMSTFSLDAATWNATHCAPIRYCEPRTGVGDRCGDGYKNLSWSQSCFHPGQFLDCPIGSHGSMNHSLRSNSKQYATVLSAAHRWETKAGRNPLPGDRTLNRQCAHADVREYDQRRPKQPNKEV